MTYQYQLPKQSLIAWKKSIFYRSAAVLRINLTSFGFKFLKPSECLRNAFIIKETSYQAYIYPLPLFLLRNVARNFPKRYETVLKMVEIRTLNQDLDLKIYSLAAFDDDAWMNSRLTNDNSQQLRMSTVKRNSPERRP